MPRKPQTFFEKKYLDLTYNTGRGGLITLHTQGASIGLWIIWAFSPFFIMISQQFDIFRFSFIANKYNENDIVTPFTAPKGQNFIAQRTALGNMTHCKFSPQRGKSGCRKNKKEAVASF
jgi:hypothetical protein